MTFKPTQVQTYDGALTITDSDPTSPQTVTLTGTGTGSAKIQLSVHSLAFGGVVFETPSKAMNVTVTNVGTAPLTLNPVTFTGADGSQLTSSSCTQSVPVNGTCTYAVVLTPTVVGSISATMNVSGNASNSPVTLNVTGNGLTAIKRSPSTINFGTVSVGKTGVAKVVTISNLSTASLALIVMLCVSTAARSVLWTVSYPLAATAAERRGIGLGAAVGLLNGVWAATAVLGPLGAGLAAEHLGSRAAFGLTEAACAAALAVTVAAATGRTRLTVRQAAGRGPGPDSVPAGHTSRTAVP